MRNYWKKIICCVMVVLLVLSSSTIDLAASKIENETILQESDESFLKEEEVEQQDVDLKEEEADQQDVDWNEDVDSEYSEEELATIIFDEMDYGDEEANVCNPEEIVPNESSFVRVFMDRAGTLPVTADNIPGGTIDDPWKIGATARDTVIAYIDGDTLVIDGKGNMKTYYQSGSATVLIREWQEKHIERVVVKNTVSKTGGYAFANMEDLREVVFEGANTTINAGAFQGCINLTEVTLPENLKILNGSTFYGCSSLTSIELPSTLYKIMQSVFRASGIESIDLVREDAAKLTSLESYAFKESALKEITIPSGITSMGNEIFSDCPNLKSVAIEDGNTHIYSGQFSSCKSLEEVWIPYSMKVIDDNGFFDDTSLKKVHYYGDMDEWEQITKGVANDSLQKASIYYIVRIQNASELMKMLDRCKNGDDLGLAELRLENDIDMTPYCISNGANSDKIAAKFKGTLDGYNHEIRNLTMAYTQSKNAIGLFESLEEGAVIRNVTFKDAKIKNSANGGEGIGVIAGYINGDATLENVHLDDCEVKGYNWVGGLIGGIKAGSTVIKNCSSNANITCVRAHAGGLVGVSNSGKTQTFQDCLFTGVVETQGDGGGIIGWLGNNNSNPAHVITGCRNEGTVNVKSNADIGGFAGGIVGGLRSDSRQHEISNNSNAGKIHSIKGCDKQFHAGGIVGYCGGGGTFQDNTNEKSGEIISDYGLAGGIVASVYWGPCEFYDCQNSGDIRATEGAAGILALDYDDEKDPALTFDGCLNQGDIFTTVGDAGGIAGKIRSDNQKHIIKNNKNEGRVETSFMSGGIVGYLCGGSPEIDNNENTGEIITTGAEKDAGGIIGGIEDDPVTVTNCYNSGSITGQRRGGGIVGYAGSPKYDPKHTFIGNINDGTVDGYTSDAGGIVADLCSDNHNHVVQNNINNGDVTGARMTGGIIGWMVGGCPDMSGNENYGSNISTTLCAGGIVGSVEDDPCNYADCKSIGYINGREQSGRICGRDGYRNGRSIDSRSDYASVFGQHNIWILLSGFVVMAVAIILIRKRLKH